MMLSAIRATLKLVVATTSLLSWEAIPQSIDPAARLINHVPAVIPEQPDVVFQQYPLVHRVDCLEGRGSAFRVGQNRWYSVAHVTRGHLCRIDGAAIAVTQQDEVNDFAQITTPTGAPNGFQIDCNGFVPGRWYWAIGYAGGLGFQTAVAIWATTYTSDRSGERIFVSPHTVIPGMSGGPVIDPATGKVVGTVNAYNGDYRLSFSRELKDTDACKGNIA